MGYRLTGSVIRLKRKMEEDFFLKKEDTDGGIICFSI